MANKAAQWENSKTLCVLGGLMSGAAYLANMVNWIEPKTMAISLLAGAASIGYGLYTRQNTKIEKFFQEAGLKNNDITPTILDRHNYEGGYSYIVEIPPGMCLSDFAKKKEAMEQFFRASIDLKFDTNLIINVRTTPLKEQYPYEVVNYPEPLKIAIGYSRKGIYSFDIEKAIHVLIAGATGAGKSVLLRSIITSLILTKKPEDICIHLVDFMRVELGIFKKSSMISDFCYRQEEFMDLLQTMANESSMRLEMFESQNIVNIKTWNRKNPDKKLKYHIVLVDEFAALADKRYKSILDMLKLRIAQDRKCGIHYVLCTQRPSRDIIDGTIKANLPTRICLMTSSDSDSDIVIDQFGAEKLRGKGHALVKMGTEFSEIQTLFLDEEEAQELIKHTYREKHIYQVQPTTVITQTETSGVIYRA